MRFPTETFETMLPIGPHLTFKDKVPESSQQTSKDTDCVGLFITEEEHHWLITSMLFQSAVSNSANGNSVVVIRCEPLSKLPASIHGMTAANSSSLRHVKFLYMKTSQELLEYLASIHTLQVKPFQIVIYDMNNFIPMNLVQIDVLFELANLCAAIKDAAVYMNRNRPTTDCYPVLVSTKTLPDIESSIYHTYFRHIWTTNDYNDEQTCGVEVKELPMKALTKKQIVSHMKVLASDPVDLVEFGYSLS